MTGYLYLAIATVAFAVMGCTYKVADQHKCDRPQLNFFYFATSTALGAAWVASAVLPPFSARGGLLGLSYGLVLFLTILAFRETASRGPISISWTLLNLSLVVPVVAGIFIWGEYPSIRHYIGLTLTLAAIILIGYDIKRSKN